MHSRPLELPGRVAVRGRSRSARFTSHSRLKERLKLRNYFFQATARRLSSSSHKLHSRCCAANWSCDQGRRSAHSVHPHFTPLPGQGEEGAERQVRVGCHSERSRGISYYFCGCTDYDFSAS